MILDLHIQDHFFEQVKNGLKTIEGRLAKQKFTQLTTGDQICFNKKLLVKVAATRQYSSFKLMIESEGLEHVLPGIPSLEEGVSIYHQFYSIEEEQLYGVIAIELYKET